MISNFIHLNILPSKLIFKPSCTLKGFMLLCFLLQLHSPDLSHLSRCSTSGGSKNCMWGRMGVLVLVMHHNSRWKLLFQGWVGFGWFQGWFCFRHHHVCAPGRHYLVIDCWHWWEGTMKVCLSLVVPENFHLSLVIPLIYCSGFHAQEVYNSGPQLSPYSPKNLFLIPCLASLSNPRTDHVQWMDVVVCSQTRVELPFIFTPCIHHSSTIVKPFIIPMILQILTHSLLHQWMMQVTQVFVTSLKMNKKPPREWNVICSSMVCCIYFYLCNLFYNRSTLQ